MTAPALLIRPSTPADLPAITAIYTEAVGLQMLRCYHLCNF